MIIRRWEVRTRNLDTMEDITEQAGGPERFFIRRFAEDACRNHNTMRLILGFQHWAYYVHDRREDVTYRGEK